jgi:hypothetical protein
MPEANFQRKAIVLYDEQGTPTFQPGRESNWFLGVAVKYDLSDEGDIFGSCSKLFGLSRAKPLKNRYINKARAEQISHLAVELPIQIVARSVHLGNWEFCQALTAYEQLASELRKKYRQVRESNIAQRLFSQVLVETVFTSIMHYTERHLANCAVSVYVDAWSFPRDDIEIHLSEWPKLIERDVNSFYKEQGPRLNVCVAPISLMKRDSRRKRFVDVMASVVSRSFLYQGTARFSMLPFETLLTRHPNRYEDITEETVDFVKRLMDDISRNPPVD